MKVSVVGQGYVGLPLAIAAAAAGQQPARRQRPRGGGADGLQFWHGRPLGLPVGERGVMVAQALSLEGVNLSVPGKHILRDVSLQLQTGEVLAMVREVKGVMRAARR